MRSARTRRPAPRHLRADRGGRARLVLMRRGARRRLGRPAMVMRRHPAFSKASASRISGTVAKLWSAASTRPANRPESAATNTTLRNSVMGRDFPSVAGKRHRMTVVVAGIVHDFHLREAEEPHDEDAEQRGHCELRGARCGAPTGRETGKPWSFQFSSFHPPPEGTQRISRRRQVSWLADLHPPRLPEARASVAFGDGYRLQLRGQPRLWGQNARTAFPLVLPEPSTRATIG